MPRLTTPLCRLLDLSVPILGAPISSSPAYVAAVSAAGGLGVLQATWLGRDVLLDAIAAIRSLTDRPFGVNFVLAFTAEDDHAGLDLALEQRVPLVSTFWGDPAPVIERIHGAGALSLHTVGSAEEARRVTGLGVDAVVAQGVEAGGHVWGEVGTFVLVPSIVEALPDAHVIAAGGIANGRGLAAALALGAGAVWIGTRLLLAEECNVHPAYKQLVVSARETDTLLSSAFDGDWPDAPHRCLMNQTLQSWIAAGRPAPGERPGEQESVAFHKSGEPIPRYSSTEPMNGMTGDIAAMALYAGQGAGLAGRQQPVAEILAEMVSEAKAVLAHCATL